MRHLRTLLTAGLASLAAAFGALSPAHAAGSGPVPPEQSWPHGGVNSFTSFGKTYDRHALQRGFQVYKEVCAACHSMHLLSYRNLADIGFPEAEVKAIAAQYEVPDTNDAGEPIMRPALPADRFKSPFPNVKAAAAANNGKAPPDLSLVVKARSHHEDYIYALLTGYTEAAHGVVVPDGSYYNEYFPGHIIAMAQPIYDSGVTYSDGTTATIAQQASDVTQFLAWAAEPKLEDRRRIGVMVIIFLTVMAGLLFAAKRRLWADVH
jgi:ubiquinol-cytochrome c reductase cytochrome c1 subunit